MKKLNRVESILNLSKNWKVVFKQNRIRRRATKINGDLSLLTSGFRKLCFSSAFPRTRLGPNQRMRSRQRKEEAEEKEPRKWEEYDEMGGAQCASADWRVK